MNHDFFEQMEENVGYSLRYPYHVDFDKLLKPEKYNPAYSEDYHCHYFDEVLRAAYLEPRAFYLTEEDKKYYSEQELEFIEKVKADETAKLDKGYELVDLDLDEATMELLRKYKEQLGITLEEAVIDILKKFIEENKKD